MELRAAHYSAREWSGAELWEQYLERLQSAVGARLDRIGAEDPPKRKVRNSADAAGFIANFGKREDSRWVFASLVGVGIELSIHHFRGRPKGFANTLNWHFSSTFFGDLSGVERVARSFDVSNELLLPFYSICDLGDRIAAKKKPSGAVNLQAELIGVFWLTFFDKAYVDFFGRERVQHIPQARFDDRGGATLRLGASPTAYEEPLRGEIEELLGRDSFVDARDLVGKPVGRHALTFERLNKV
jgi:hypothetical protein